MNEINSIRWTPVCSH